VRKLFTPWYALPLVLLLASLVYVFSTIWIAQSDAFFQVEQAMKKCNELSVLIDESSEINLAFFGNRFSIQGDSGDMNLRIYGTKNRLRVDIKFALIKRVGIWKIDAVSSNGKELIIPNDNRSACGFT
jgi:hypothetical protein